MKGYVWIVIVKFSNVEQMYSIQHFEHLSIRLMGECCNKNVILTGDFTSRILTTSVCYEYANVVHPNMT